MLLLPSVRSFFSGWTVLGSNSGRGKRFSFPQNHPDWLRGPCSLLFKGYRVSVSGLNDWGVKLTAHHLVPRILHVVKLDNVQYMDRGLQIVLLYSHIEFSGAFAKFKKIYYLASSRLSVRLSIRMEQLGSHWTDFHEI